MKRSWVATGAVLVWLGGGPVIAGATEAPKPAVSPEAERILRGMGDYLKAAPQLSFHAEAVPVPEVGAREKR